MLDFLFSILVVSKQSRLKQVEDDYKEKLEKELSARKQVEKVFYSSSVVCYSAVFVGFSLLYEPSYFGRNNN